MEKIHKLYIVSMYSLFDTLHILCTEKNIDGDLIHKKNILTGCDIGTITDTFNFDTERVTQNATNCLMMACRVIENHALIRYLIEDCRMDIRYVDRDNKNCLMYACQYNTTQAIIKYLIECCQMDINCMDGHGNNCLMLACYSNDNFEIIKYLIEGCGMDITHVNINGTDCLMCAWCRRSVNHQIVKYLVEEWGMSIGRVIRHDIGGLPFYIFNNIVMTCHKNYHDLNDFLLMGFAEYQIADMNGLVKRINPLQLNTWIRKLQGIPEPNTYGYKKYKQLVDELAGPVDCMF